RQRLYKLRQLGAPLDVSSSDVVMDAEQVSEDSASAISTGNGHPPALDARALAFLPEYAPGLSDRYDLWLEEKRAAVSTAVRRQLVSAMTSARSSMQWSTVERLARRTLELDAFNEEATLALAEATALTGSKAKAIEILETYATEPGR